MMGALVPFNTIDSQEWSATGRLFIGGDHPLSGYLAGKERGGLYVRTLEDRWAEMFHVRHAIAVNSATSGLLAAAFAIGLKPGDKFVCPAMTMSATAAAPMFTGAEPLFCDVEDETFALDSIPPDWNVSAIFVTNLFGHPARLKFLREIAIACNIPLIEDNAQSPFAWERDKYAGTIGHIGVFSLNIHKPIQCGEGGMVVTDDDDLAQRMRAFINHGENLISSKYEENIGLNLRMPELCAAVARVQLDKADKIIQSRIDQAEAIVAATSNIPGLRGPVTRFGYRHVFYAIPFLIERNRAEFCGALRAMGVPIVEGYVAPLYNLPAFAKYERHCPVAEDLHDWRLFYFENCAWDLTLEQIEQIGAAFHKAARVL